MKWIKLTGKEARFPEANDNLIVKMSNGKKVITPHTGSTPSNIFLRDQYIEWLDESPEGSEAWVSVEDRLPENNDNVLVFANKTGEQIDVAFYDDESKEWAGLNSYWITKITHWQPLPQPPIK